jgi:hypothetical protein
MYPTSSTNCHSVSTEGVRELTSRSSLRRIQWPIIWARTYQSDEEAAENPAMTVVLRREEIATDMSDHSAHCPPLGSITAISSTCSK